MWGSRKFTPILSLNRKYFGEQIGFYFAWLGVYTQLLIPPSVLGVIVFLYGIFTVDDNVPRQAHTFSLTKESCGPYENDNTV